jgi:hypothetical protein
VGDIAPRFVKRYAEVGHEIERAIGEYAADVRAGRFPAPEHCYGIAAEREAEIRNARSRGTRATTSTVPLRQASAV